MVGVQEWAEIRAMRTVERLSIKEITRRTGHSRNTIRSILRSAEPPSYGPRTQRPSKLDPHKDRIHELLGKGRPDPRAGDPRADHRGRLLGRQDDL